MMQFSSFQTLIFLLALLCGALTQASCLSFSYPEFKNENETDFLWSEKDFRIINDAIQVTIDVSGGPISNQSGRVLYKKKFRLWGDGGRKKASFNSTFNINISNRTDPGAEGLAFILTANETLPENSNGQWLGIVNASSNGSIQARIVAVEFDTSKSYEQDLDDNHVGVDVNSIYSLKQESLTRYGIRLSSGTNYTVTVQYDSQNLTIFISHPTDTGDQMNDQVLSLPLNLTEYLPEKVYVGFSASTGNNTQLNCITSWNFTSSRIEENPNLLWVWIATPAAVVFAFLAGVASYIYWRRHHGKELLEDAYPWLEDEIQSTAMAPKKFELKELQRATSRFNPKNKLGKGGFGTVYKGCLGNKEIAVKRISKNSRQGMQEFIAEVTTIGSLRHKNLVKLIGWCYERQELLIVYELMPNGSLDRFLFGENMLGKEMEEPPLSWERRHNIINGVAQALDYLHNGCEKRVLHRDIKASNIMLDADFTARLGDFGLARTLQQSEVTHHSTKEIAGTPGYMAPETFLTARATVETDVYAFGVLVLEVACGRRPAGNQVEQSNYNNSIVYWLWDLYSRGRVLDAVDSRLDGDTDEDDMVSVLTLGLACCHPDPHQRPSMRTVLKVLTREADPPVLPIERPAFVWPSMPPSFKEDTECDLAGGRLTPFTEIIGR
ncbi:probable L-type lectin-domain containing receptor kinase S.5 [Argentina anserina]|uniref:probable L-type lectin-domain containing receptor kinase S.5 n=1 Tax=Argentina anserina TaxID=57926 RepID=UPI0021763455|nr:probable L-type lectin-domain containing receptor kinase S.5 [Potentilla anserina]